MASTVRERICGSKVRTGCSTCKARHIKCTEERPSCRRCVSGHRLCKYEEPRPRRRPEHFTFVNYAAQTPLATLLHSSWDPQERRALSFFRERTALDLAGPLTPHFFTETLLSIAENEPAVRHALTALGTVHEVYGRSELPQVPEFALHQYGKAIHGIVDLQTADTPNAVEIVLATCIIFALLESMRGFHHSCLSHLVAGLKVLREMQINGQYQSSQVHLITKALQWIFIRIDSQVLDIGGVEFGHGVQVYHGIDIRIPAEFKDVDDSMFHIELLYNRVMYHLMKWEPIISVQGQGEEVQKPLLEERDYYLHELEKFRNAYRRLVDKRHIPTSDKHEAALLAISLSIKVIAVLLEINDFVNTETQFDKCFAQFQAMVKESEAFIEVSSRSGPRSAPSTSKTATPASVATDGSAFYNHTSPQQHSKTASFPTATATTNPPRAILTMASGCVLPLYFVAARCRHSPTRHKALRLLKTCNRREGLWDSALAAGIAEKLITIEESKARAMLLQQHQQRQTHRLQQSLERNEQQHENHQILTDCTLHLNRSPISKHGRGVDDNDNDNDNYEAEETLHVPDEVRIRTVMMYYDDEEGGRAEFSMQPPWSMVVQAPGARYAGLRSVEKLAFGTPGPRAVVTQVISKC